MESEKNVAREWRRGWPVVAAGAIGIGTGPALAQNLTSFFVPGITAEFGWSRGEIATAAAIGLIGSLAVPFLGRVADRVGIRAVIIGCMLLLSIAYLGVASMTGALWQYQAFVFILALTVPGTSSVVYGKLIAAAFVAHRGLAMGIATSGVSVATLILPPFVAAAIANFGWRGGYVAMAIVVALSLPLVLIAIRGVPAGPTRPDPGSLAARSEVAGLTGAETRRDGRFWRLGATAFFINAATVGLITSLVPFGTDRGLSAGEAGLLVTAYAASQIVGRLGIGALVDRFPPQRVTACVAIISAIGFAGLELANIGLAATMAFVFLAALMHGAENDVLPYFTARLFGLRAYGEAYGSLLVIALAGTATGISAFGLLHDATGSYAVALAIASVAQVVAAGLFLTLGERPLPVWQAAAGEP